jgi:hypothetical protein
MTKVHIRQNNKIITLGKNIKSSTDIHLPIFSQSKKLYKYRIHN